MTCITCKYHTRPEFNNICLWCDESFSNYEPAEKKEKLMTCIEKYMREHPDELDPATALLKDIGCPEDYGYMDEPDYCCTSDDGCERCWNREIPEGNEESMTESKPCPFCEEKEKNKMIYAHIGPFEESTSNDNSNWIIDDTEESTDTTEWPKENPNLLKNVAKNDAPRILDSGDRTQFETGAVRDCQAGKGRCDLLPLDVVSDYLEDPIINHISKFCRTGDKEVLYKALWDFSSHWDTDSYGTSDVANANMLLEVSKHFEDGAVKYGDDNWRKGIPTKRYIDSAVRHYLKFLRGDKDERHDRALCWNLLCCIWTCVHKPELNDYIKTSEVIRG